MEDLNDIKAAWRDRKTEAAEECRRRGAQNLAFALDSCEMLERADCVPHAFNMLFTPQGSEFATKYGFPAIEAWRRFGGELDGDTRLHLDAGEVEVVSTGQTALVGDTTAKVTCQGCARFCIVLMHGAKAEITATGGAVVRVHRDGNSSFTSKTEDRGLIFG